MAPPEAGSEVTGARVFPASFGQRRIWFLEQLEPGSSAYNIAVAIHLEGALDVPAFGRALAEIVRRHDALRTSFAVEAGEPVQVVARQVSFDLPVVDLAACPGRDTVARELTLAYARSPFDLTRPPLLAALLLRLGERRHRLVLSIHHIVSDGWSLGVLVRETAEHYAAFAAGRPSPLPPLTWQYADWTLWQQEHLRGETLERQLAHFRSRLAGVPAELHLWPDHPRTGAGERPAASFEVRLPPASLASLTTLGRKARVTPFLSLLALTAAALARWSGQDELVLGTPVANRGRQEVEGLIGLFINTLALAARIGPRSIMSELMAALREELGGAFSHMDLPFERLVEELKPERVPGVTPLFQVLVSMQNAPLPPLTLPGVQLTPEPLTEADAQFDLTIDWREGDGEARARWTYDSALFEEATMRRLAGLLEVLVAGLAEAPAAPVAELPLLSAAERGQLLETGRGAEPAAEGLAAAWLRRAREMPEAPALLGWSEAGGEEEPQTLLSYGELARRAGILAWTLRSLGVGAEVPVGLAVPRDASLAVGFWGILAAGGTAVPLDPALPEERRQALLEDAGVRLVVTVERLADASDALSARRLVQLDHLFPASAAAASGPLPDPGLAALASATQAAYVIYTSGSTGTPKGVAVPHGAVAHHARAFAAAAELTATDRVLQFAALSFDVAIEELFPSWLAGAAVVLAPESARTSPSVLAHAMAAAQVTVANLPAPFFHEWVADLLRGGAAVPETLRLLLTGSDAVSPGRWREWRQRTAVPVWNAYGPTEATVTATIHRSDATAAAAVNRASLPIGRPLGAARAYVLDRRGQLLPPGAGGELGLGGPGVARGYLGLPGLTAASFIPDPFAGEPGSRLYRTGDLARRLTSGEIELLGRVDRQVKVRGVRIEPGEIEAVLAELSSVREAAVLAVGEGGERRLVAAVVASDPAAEITEGGALAAELRAELARRLPPAFVPQRFAFLASLPKLASGKLDRRALAAAVAERAERAERAQPAGRRAVAETPTEEALAGIWSEVLGLAEIGTDENFFELGGHSLLATQVVSRVRVTFGVELPLADLFAAPTVAALAERIDRLGVAGTVLADAPDAAPEPGPPVSRERELPLSFAQERLWFLDRLGLAGAAYNMPLALAWELPPGKEREGHAVPARFAAVLGEVVRRHEALRTTFSETLGRPVQRISAAEPRIALPVIDLARLPQALRAREVRRMAEGEASRPFDLERGPLLRAFATLEGAGRGSLVASLHHIVSDGWSLGVLLAEMGALYGAVAAGLPLETALPPLPVQYADFALWQRERIAGAYEAELLDFWRRHLDGAPRLALPTDRPRPPKPGHRGGKVDIAIAPGLYRLAWGSQATLFMVTLAAWAALLGRLSGEEDVVVGSPIAGRNHLDTEKLIGFFVNTLAMRLDLTGDPGFADLIGRVRRTVLDAQAHQDLPFERLVEELRPDRRLSHNPLFDTAFAFHNAPEGSLALPGLTLSGLELELTTARFDLVLNLEKDGRGGLIGSLEYDLDLFDRTTAMRLARTFQNLLAEAARHRGRRLSQLTALAPEERHALLVDWNDAPEVRAGGLVAERVAAQAAGELLPVHRQVERTAAAFPGEVAAVFAGESLTYRELNRRANRLARALVRRGVGPESYVGICLERSLAMLVGMLAVFKAGGAGVALDPAYPEERLSFIIRDARLSVLLTDDAMLARFPEHQGIALRLPPSGDAFPDEHGGDLGEAEHRSEIRP